MDDPVHIGLRRTGDRLGERFACCCPEAVGSRRVGGEPNAPAQHQFRLRDKRRCAASTNSARPSKASAVGSGTAPGGSGCVV